jgi:hypothetical protein
LLAGLRVTRFRRINCANARLTATLLSMLILLISLATSG